MPNEKNLKKVSGGVPQSPILIAAERHGRRSKQFYSACKKAGLSPNEITWEILDEVAKQTDAINKRTYITPEDYSFLKQWNIPF